LKDAKANDPRLSKFAKIFGVFIGIAAAFAFRAVVGTKDAKKKSTSADGFTKYRLTGREELSTTSSIFSLRPISGSGLSFDEESLRRAITSIQIKQPQLQIARSYTLLPAVPGQDPDELRLLIRREQNGEVSGYLHRLSLGAEVEMRGPSAEYALPEKVQKVIFLAGGTGIVPALQVSRVAAGQADVHILWANRRREDCEGGVSDTATKPSSWSATFASWTSMFGMASTDIVVQDAPDAKSKNTIVAQLEDVKQSGQGRLAVDYFVDEENAFIKPTDATRLVRSSFSTGNESEGSKIIFVSGPEGFVKYWAGPKEWANGREVQGALGGILASLDLRGWEVVKL
jgi:hypothetical protein